MTRLREQDYSARLMQIRLKYECKFKEPSINPKNSIISALFVDQGHQTAPPPVAIRRTSHHSVSQRAEPTFVTTYDQLRRKQPKCPTQRILQPSPRNANIREELEFIRRNQKQLQCNSREEVLNIENRLKEVGDHHQFSRLDGRNHFQRGIMETSPVTKWENKTYKDRSQQNRSSLKEVNRQYCQERTPRSKNKEKVQQNIYQQQKKIQAKIKERLGSKEKLYSPYREKNNQNVIKKSKEPLLMKEISSYDVGKLDRIRERIDRALRCG